MSSFAKWVMIILGTVVALVIAAVVVVALVVLRPENYEGVVTDMVRDATGREFKGAAGAKIHFFPLGLEGSDFVFGNAEGFGPDPMVSIESIEFRVRFMPLLSGEIVVSEVHMDGVKVLLQRNKKGVSNWDDLTGKSSETSKDSTDSSGAKATSSDKSVSFAVEDLTVDDLELVYEDRSTGARYELSQGDIDLLDFELGKPFRFNIKTKLTSNKPVLVTTVDLAGKAKVDVGRSLYSVSGLKGHVDAAGDVIPGEALGADLAALGIVLDLKSELLKAEGLEVKVQDAALSAHVTVNKLMSAPLVQAKLDAEPFDLRGLMGTLAVALPEMADESALKKVGGTFDVLYSKEKLIVSDMNLSLDDASITGVVGMTGFDKPAYKAVLKVDELDVNRYLPPRHDASEVVQGDQQGNATESGVGAKDDAIPAALSELEADVQADVGRLKVSNFDFSELYLHVTAKKGEQVVEGAALPAVTGVFKVGQLVVDRTRPSEQEGESTGNSTSTGEEAEGDRITEIIPVELLRKLDVDVQADVVTFTDKNLNLSDIKVHAKAKNGRLTVDPCLVSGYGGTTDSVLIVDASDKTPRTELVTEIKTLQIGPLLKDLTGKDSLQGKTDLYLDVGSNGSTLDAMKKSLEGKLRFALYDGVFPGVDVSELVQETRSAKKDSGKIEAEADDKTKFGSITASAKAKDGILTTGDLEVRAPNIRAIGEGDVDLVKQKLSFLVKAKLVPSGKGQGGDSYEDTIGVPVPIHVSGSLQKPSYFVNPLEYIRMLGVGVVDTVGGAVKGVGSIFQGLIPGKKKEEPAEQQQ